MRSGRRLYVDDRFVGANQVQPIVYLGNRAFGIEQPVKLAFTLAAMFAQRLYVLLNGRKRMRHRHVLIHDARKLDRNQSENDDGNKTEDQTAKETKDAGRSRSFHGPDRTASRRWVSHAPIRRYFR